MATSSTDRFVVKELRQKEEMAALIRCEFDSYYDPYHPFAQVLWPVFDPTEAGQAAAMAGAVDRQWSWHEPDPHSHWFYVVEQSTGRIAGGAQWYYHDADPFSKPGPKLEAYWWPKGDARDFCTSMLVQVFGPRANKMNRPHTMLNLMFVHPDFRRKGVGSLLMQPGVDKATEMGWDTFVEGTDVGRTLYEKFGYRTLYRGEVNMKKEKPSNLWKRLEFELTPVHWWFMWKPVDGTFEEGETTIPFEIPEERGLDRYVRP